MPNETEVINSALGLLGESRVLSLDDGSELAKTIELRYPIVRDAVLEAHPWNFAMTRQALVQSAITPAFDWAYQYPFPTTPWCLTIRDTDDEGSGWEVGYDAIDGRVVLSDNSTLKIRYTARIEDVGIWSPLAVLALTYLLAADLAINITGQVAKADQYQDRFEKTLPLATSSDSREGSPVVIQAPQGMLFRRR